MTKCLLNTDFEIWVSLWINKWLKSCKYSCFYWRIGWVLWNGKRTSIWLVPHAWVSSCPRNGLWPLFTFPRLSLSSPQVTEKLSLVCGGWLSFSAFQTPPMDALPVISFTVPDAYPWGQWSLVTCAISQQVLWVPHSPSTKQPWPEHGFFSCSKRHRNASLILQNLLFQIHKAQSGHEFVFHYISAWPGSLSPPPSHFAYLNITSRALLTWALI